MADEVKAQAESTEEKTQAAEEQKSEESTEESEDSTLLGTAKTESTEEEAAAEAENKRLLEAKDEELSAEDKQKKSELVKKQGEAKLKEVPEKYEVPKIEGAEVNTALVEKLSPVLKKHNITQEGFNELVQAYAPVVKEQFEAQKKASLDAYNELTEGWKNETQKELGADWQKKLAPAAKLMDKTGMGQEVREVLEETKVGNHPVMVKFLIKLGELISSDSLVAGRSANAPAGPEKLYDHPTSQKSMAKK